MTRRWIAAVAAVAVVAGVAVAAARLPSRSVPREPARRLSLAVGSPDLACPGPETRSVPRGASAVDPGGEVMVSALSVDPDVGTDGGRRTAPAAVERTKPGGTNPRRIALDVAADGLSVARFDMADAGPAILGASAEPDTDVPLLAATQSTLAWKGDLRGLVATSCARAATESWLVGGATTAGHRLRLLLTDPAGTPAVADVEVYGPSGRVSAPSGTGVVVPAHGQVPIFVDALAPDLDRVVVHVTVRSGLVQAALHESLLRGLVPGGADDVPPAAAPATRQVVPGLSVLAPKSAAAMADLPAGTEVAAGKDSPGTSVVRVAVPGTEEGVVRVRLLSGDRVVDLDPPAVANVPAGGVVDVPVTGVPDGDYAAFVESDVPVLAGAMVARALPASGRALTSDVTAGIPPAEFAWTAAARPLGGAVLVALPADVRATLTLVAPDGAAVATVRELRPSGETAEPRTVSLSAGSTADLEASAEATGLLVTPAEGSGPLMGAVVLQATDQSGPVISALPLASSGSRTVRVPFAVHDPRLGLP